VVLGLGMIAGGAGLLALRRRRDLKEQRA